MRQTDKCGVIDDTIYGMVQRPGLDIANVLTSIFRFLKDPFLFFEFFEFFEFLVCRFSLKLLCPISGVGILSTVEIKY